VERGKRTFDWSAKQLSGFLYRFLEQSLRERVMQRNNVENNSSSFDWQNLIKYYNAVYQMAASPATSS
jgi:glycogen(starch) synthase